MLQPKPNSAIMIVVAAFCVLAGLYALVTPLFEGPDAGDHFRYIVYLQRTHQLPTFDQTTAAFSHELVQQPPFYYALAALASAGINATEALELNQINPYYQKGLSQRATITPLRETWTALLPIFIAKFVAFLGGLLTVLGSWFCARLLLQKQATFALAVAAVVGLNPQFLFSASTITNDTWAAALFVWAIALSLYSRNAVWSLLGWFLAGMCAGLAALTKYSGLLVIAPLGLIWLTQAGRMSGLRLFHQMLCLVAGFLLTGGFWYVSNWAATGSLTPLQQILALLPGLTRPKPLAFWDPKFWEEVRWLLRSYWGVFGYGIIAPAAYHAVIQNMIGLALLGLCLLPLRWLFLKQPSQWALLGLAALWFGVIFVSLLNWIHLVYFANQGRLLFPAAPAIAILLVLGLQAWLPQGWQSLFHYGLTLVFLGLAISQLPTVYHSYQIPLALTPPAHYDRPLNVSFSGGMQVLGIDLPAGAALRPGKAMPVTLYFTTEKEITDFYTLFIHLADDQDQLLYRFDGVPAQGRHPTRQWAPQQIFADTYWLNTATPHQAKLATLSLGFYNYQDAQQRQRLFGAGGKALGDRLVLAKVRVHTDDLPAAPAYPRPLARWQNGIQLLTAKLEQTASHTPSILHTEWGTTQVIQRDYTVFVQLLDATGQLLAQVDQQPQAGQFPTSTWQPGDVIQDVYTFVAPTLQWQKLIIGLYDAQQQRLLLETPEAPQDFYLLLQNGAPAKP